MRARLALLAALTALLPATLAVPVSGHPLDVADTDHDGVRNAEDNCPDVHNPPQTDTDGDGETPRAPSGTPASPPPETGGDACDTDDDADQVKDALDNCSKLENADQRDADADGEGDVCDPDDDGDGIFDRQDLCPRVPDPDQRDGDRDRIGDACDPDAPKRPGTAADRRAPRLQVRVAATHRVAAIRAGIAVTVECSEACSLQSELRVDPRTARRARLPRTLAQGAATIEARGRTFVFVRLPASALRRLARAGGVRATLRVRAQDVGGNRRSVDRRIRIVR